jgi:hypothetical protein
MMLPRAIMAFFWGLVICWLLQGDGVATASVKSDAAPWPTKIEGDAMDDHDHARNIALEKAQRAIENYLAQQNPPLEHWKPSLVDVQKLVKKEGKGPDFTAGAYVFKKWELTLRAPDLELFRKLNRAAFQEYEAKERRLRALARLRLTGEVLVGLVVLLTTVVAYIRLDDHMRHAHSRLLQVGTASIVIATGLGLWFLR